MTPRVDAILERLNGGETEQRLRALEELRTELDTLEVELVAGAVRAGWSWTQIGAALGVSKQAAHSKHGKTAAVSSARRAIRPRPAAGVPDDERTSLAGSDVREAVRLARKEAAALGQRVVGTEHLLVGVLEMDEGPAGAALRTLGVTVAEARSVLEPTLELSPSDRAGGLTAPIPPPDERRPNTAVSPLARQVLERSLRQALRRRGGRLSAAGLLAEVLADRDGGAARTLARLGVAPEAVIARLDSADHGG